MTDLRFHYPDYDVMESVNEWDSYTKELVLKRLGPFPEKRFLEQSEERKLRAIIKHITYDDRDYILDWILYYIDLRLDSGIGESHREINEPPEKVLVREGLKALDKLSLKIYNKEFVDTDVKEQFEMLSSLQLKKAVDIPDWSTIPQKALFQKLLDLIISSYYSHPKIWSEMGYGGPAYPRGYYRIELAFTDPWEAKRPGHNEGERKRNGK